MEEEKCKRHKWIYDSECSNCGYREECCERCWATRLLDPSGKEVTRDE